MSSEIIRASSISKDDLSLTEPSSFNLRVSTKSIGRDFAPLFFILSILFALILLAFISTFYNHRIYRKSTNVSQNGRHTNNSVYSQLTSENEFDLNS